MGGGAGEENKERFLDIDVSGEEKTNGSIKVGMRVLHSTYGEGVVRDSTGEKERQKVTVWFPAFGERRLMVKYANLSIL